MGRAIVRQPQVFLFDEPLSNLDAKLRAQTRLEIQKLHQRAGHHLAVRHPRPGRGHDAGPAHDRDERGRMEQFGTPEEVYARPATTFVASFIGSPPDEPADVRVRRQAQRRRCGLPVARHRA
jgi:sn-glycerol 3-phosphate transport system ATP-binding protein